MRVINLLIAGILCLFFWIQPLQAQDLKKTISLEVEKAALPDVLQLIQKKCGQRFSYLNNELVADTIYHFHIKEKPLIEVLDQLLEESKAGYKQLNGQIIIKKAYYQQKKEKSPEGKKSIKEKKQASVMPVSKQEAEEIANEESPLAKAETVQVYNQPLPDSVKLASTEDAAALLPLNVPGDQDSVASVEKEEVNPAVEVIMEEEAKNVQQHEAVDIKEDGQRNNIKTANRPLNRFWEKRGGTKAEDHVPDNSHAKEREANKIDIKTILSRSKKTMADLKEKWANEEDEPNDKDIKPFHFGFVYPLSNHGLKAPEYVNRFSAHMLIGVADGLKGWELSGLGNIEKDYVSGMQFAGLFNLVGNKVKGGQFAGVLNISGGKMKGGQFAGALNFNRQSMEGGQFAGFGNFTSGEGRGTQAAGFINIAGSLTGAQLAGFQNSAKDIKGLQAAGFINTASHVEGVQVAGFINTAGYIKGSQLGFLNFADSMDGGVALGVLSFVKNGYKALEVYTSEDFHANINFKTGVSHFYNILALGVEMDDNRRWGYGYGVGSEWTINRKFRFNTDLISYQLVEESFLKFPQGLSTILVVNSLNKLRVLGTLQLGKNFAIFGGPTYNITVSRYKENPEASPGPGLLVNNTFFDRTNRGTTNVRMWLGFNAGIRF